MGQAARRNRYRAPRVRAADRYIKLSRRSILRRDHCAGGKRHSQRPEPATAPCTAPSAARLDEKRNHHQHTKHPTPEKPKTLHAKLSQLQDFSTKKILSQTRSANRFTTGRQGSAS